MERKVIKDDFGKPIIIIESNTNVKATHFLLTNEVEIELKSNCDKKVREMWELLNKPIRRDYEIHSRRKTTRKSKSKNVL